VHHHPRPSTRPSHERTRNISPIKGAARRSVRPKSREETPKEGNETGKQARQPRPCHVDVRRTKSNSKILQCRSAPALQAAAEPNHAGDQGRSFCAPAPKRRGRSSGERPKSREETPKVGYGTSAQPHMPLTSDMVVFVLHRNCRSRHCDAIDCVCGRMATWGVTCLLR
jgi:hypothetical protein